MSLIVCAGSHRGLAFASDSAAAWCDARFHRTEEEAKRNVHHITYTSEKVHQLAGLPVVLAGTGALGTGKATLAAAFEALQARFIGEDPEYPDWELNPASYSLEAITQRVQAYLQEHYRPQMRATGTWTSMHVMIGGYDPGKTTPDLFQFKLTSDGPDVPPPIAVIPHIAGLYWCGITTSIDRLIYGFSNEMIPMLWKQLAPAPEAMQRLGESVGELHFRPTSPDMPVTELLALVEWLADLAVGYSRFGPVPRLVGGPIDLVTVSRAEGFQWVRRKPTADNGVLTGANSLQP